VKGKSEGQGQKEESSEQEQADYAVSVADKRPDAQLLRWSLGKAIAYAKSQHRYEAAEDAQIKFHTVSCYCSHY